MSADTVNAEVYWHAIPGAVTGALPAGVPALAFTFETHEEGMQIHGFLLNGLGDVADILPLVARQLRLLAESADRSAVAYASQISEWMESPEYLLGRLEQGLTLGVEDEDG
jgi:hypothetical protein